MLFNVITIIALTVPVFVLAAQTPDPRGGSDGITIPLTKRSHIDAREFHASSHNAKLIRGPSGMDSCEMNTGTLHPSGVKRDGSGGNVYLTMNSLDSTWYGIILIGTPPKSFTVQFSTGSSDLFVAASTSDENSRSHPNLWDPASFHITTNLDLNTEPPPPHITNVDLNTDFSIVFKDARIARGKQYADNVTIAGLTADIQTIGAATTFSSSRGASAFVADGILGLAFPSQSVFQGRSPLLHTLYNEGKLSQPVFSLKLTTSGGELYVGGTNRALYAHNTIVFTPVTNPGRWQVKIDNIQVNGAIVLTDVTAVIDTGSHYVIGDLHRVLALNRAANGELFEGGPGYYTFRCASFPSIIFTIGGTPLLMPAQAFNQGRVGNRSPRCISGIASVEASQFWSIGTIFLQHFYTVFDFNSESPRVGFAQLT